MKGNVPKRVLSAAVLMSTFLLLLHVGQAEAGELIILRQCEGPDAGQLRGLAWDGSSLWADTSPDGWSSTIYKLKRDCSVAITCPSPSVYTTGIAWINGQLWSVDNFTDTLVEHQQGTSCQNIQVIQQTFSLHGRRTPDGIAWCGSFIWVANEQAVQQFDINGNFLGEVNTSVGFGDLTCMRDEFLLAAGGNTIYKLKLDSSLSTVDTFTAPGSQTGGLAFDGLFLWVADSGTNKIYRTLLLH